MAVLARSLVFFLGVSARGKADRSCGLSRRSKCGRKLAAATVVRHNGAMLMQMARRVRQAVAIKNKFQQLLFAGEFEEARRVADAELAKEAESKQTKPRKESQAPAKVIQFPIWAEPQRASPNALIRSALFSAAKRRRQAKKERLAAWGDTEIWFTGETFNQDDEHVWLELVHLYRKQSGPEDCKVRFRAKPFLRELGAKKSGGSNIKRLEGSILRLLACGVVVRHQRMEYGASLVTDYAYDEDSGRFVVQLNPKYLELFGTGHTRIDWETRKSLPSGLPSWLYREVMSHRATEQHPHRDSVNDLRERSGMRSTQLKHFRSYLRAAMSKLKEAGAVESWRITPNDALEYARPS